MSNGFTKVDNSIIENTSISFDAKGIYMIISRYISIPGFKINKSHIKSITGLGAIRFNKAWKELKENDLLMQEKKNVNGKFEYKYTLGKEKVNASTIEKPKETTAKNGGNNFFNGQVYIEETFNKDSVTIENIDTIVAVTGLNKEQSEQLLKTSDNNITKVIESHKYVMQQSNVKSIFSYMKWIIKNNISTNAEMHMHKSKGTFNDFIQRNYNFDELEKALLYGDAYVLPR